MNPESSRGQSIELQGFAKDQVVRLKKEGTTDEYEYYEVVLDPGTAGNEKQDDMVRLRSIGNDNKEIEVNRGNLSQENSNSIPPNKGFQPPIDRGIQQVQSSELALTEPKEESRFKAGNTVILGGPRRQDQIICTVVSVEQNGELRVKTPAGEVIGVIASEVRSSSNPPLDLSVAK